MKSGKNEPVISSIGRLHIRKTNIFSIIKSNLDIIYQFNRSNILLYILYFYNILTVVSAKGD